MEWNIYVISDETSAIILTLVLLQERCFYSLYLSWFSLYLVFCSSNMICLDVDILVFILLGIIYYYLASWICGLVSAKSFRKFFAIITSVFLLFSLFYFWYSNYDMLQLLKSFHSSCRFCFFPHLLFFLFVFQCGKFIFTSSHSLIFFFPLGHVQLIDKLIKGILYFYYNIFYF